MAAPNDRQRRELERERARIHAEIRNYPAPIPACDEQFNFLLEERDRVSRELARLNQATPGKAPASA